jgi:hypothetical protein
VYDGYGVLPQQPFIGAIQAKRIGDPAVAFDKGFHMRGSRDYRKAAAKKGRQKTRRANA